MTTTLDYRNLYLKEVHRLLKLERRLNNSFTSLLSLEPLTEIDLQELEKIRANFDNYYCEGKISEGGVKFLFLAPLMWLAGFDQQNIKITLEENIAEISIEDEDTSIKGRMDILAVNRTKGKITATPF